MAQSVNSGQYFIKMKHRIIAEIESIEQVSIGLQVRLGMHPDL